MSIQDMQEYIMNKRITTGLSLALLTIAAMVAYNVRGPGAAMNEVAVAACNESHYEHVSATELVYSGDCRLTYSAGLLTVESKKDSETFLVSAFSALGSAARTHNCDTATCYVSGETSYNLNRQLRPRLNICSEVDNGEKCTLITYNEYGEIVHD